MIIIKLKYNNKYDNNNNFRKEFQISTKDNISKFLEYIYERYKENEDLRIYPSGRTTLENISRLFRASGLPQELITYHINVFPLSFIQEYLETLLELSQQGLPESLENFNNIEILKKVWWVAGNVDVMKLDEIRSYNNKNKFYYLIMVNSRTYKYVKKGEDGVIKMMFNTSFYKVLNRTNFLNDIIFYFEAEKDSEALKMIKNL